MSKSMVMMRFVVCLVAAGLVGLTASPASAGPLDGSWSGSGYVKPTNGKRERVRCRIRYSRQSSKVYGVSAVCATPSANIRQSGEVLMVNPNRYVGDFYNSAYDVSGRVSVTVRGSRQSVSFSGAAGSGSMTLSRR